MAWGRLTPRNKTPEGIEGLESKVAPVGRVGYGSGSMRCCKQGWWGNWDGGVFLIMRRLWRQRRWWYDVCGGGGSGSDPAHHHAARGWGEWRSSRYRSQPVAVPPSPATPPHHHRLWRQPLSLGTHSRRLQPTNAPHLLGGERARGGGVCVCVCACVRMCIRVWEREVGRGRCGRN